MKKQNIVLSILVLILMFVPLLMQLEVEFSGADDKTVEMINQVSPNYDRWLKPLWEPSGDVETFLFAFQAAIGAGFVGYVLGHLKGYQKGKMEAACTK